MKRLLLSLVLLLVCCGCVNTQSTAYPIGYSVTKWGTEFVLDIELPDFPDKLNYYSAVRPEISADWVQAIGGKLEIRDVAGFTGDEHKIVMSQGDESVEVFASTASINIRGIHFARWTAGESISSEDAAVIGEEFIKYLGLWSDDMQLNEVAPRYGGSIKEEWGVWFNQYIDGYPLVGGPKNLHVLVNMYGTVLGSGIWKLELEKAGEISCVNARQAYERMLSGDALEFAVTPETAIHINSASLGYYLESQTELQEYVMPVYVFKGERVRWDGNTEIFRCYVKAAR